MIPSTGTAGDHSPRTGGRLVMDHLRYRIVAFARPALLLLVLCLAACSDLGPDGRTGNTISFTNSGSKVLLIAVVELETSALINFSPTILVTPGHRGLLKPRETVSLTGQDITGGYSRGDGVDVFVYDVADSVAQFRTALQVTASQLRRRHFHVYVSN